MTEKVKSVPAASVSFPHQMKDVMMKRWKDIVTELKKMPGTLVESQSGLIRSLLEGGEFIKDDLGNTYIKFKVANNDVNNV